MCVYVCWLGVFHVWGFFCLSVVFLFVCFVFAGQDSVVVNKKQSVLPPTNLGAAALGPKPPPPASSLEQNLKFFQFSLLSE